ncbi:N-formylglutamate amidohydrolase [Celeribacter sp.]|uniref:N-formylglutamate amidohydrolase n=1 Tax=Celeribacter sp. TaxID=1890673 RepID=UPI003A916877
MSRACYRVKRPKKLGSFAVFSSPHSGRDYPEDFVAKSVLDPFVLRSSEDAYVDELFADVSKSGAPFVSAIYPRAWVDLNRAEDELDPALIEGVPRGVPNPRVASGLGVIPRVVAGGRCIYSGKITRAEARSRIEVFWRPYHAIVETLLGEAQAAFGSALLVDCHSMPHEALQSAPARMGRTSSPPEIVVGDRYGVSAAVELVAETQEAFRAEGFRVARNMPFAGAYNTERYGVPKDGRHAIQIEVDRSLYMDEASLRKRDDFDDVKAALTRAGARIAALGGDEVPLAAE